MAITPIDFEGEPIDAVEGESVAAALARHGRLRLSTARDGSGRGPYCGMGVCQDCRVSIDGRPNQRACLTKVVAGMRITASAARTGLAGSGPELASVPAAPLEEEAIDILVVGAGPAGLAAATAAAANGATVAIVDERALSGGQFYKQPGHRSAPPGDEQAATGAARIAAARAAGVLMRQDTLVWGGFREGADLVIGTLNAGVARYIRPKILVIAGGAFEQPGIFPGWTLPGAMTTGAIQTLLRGDGAVPAGRILIAGNGPLNLQVAAELARAGANVVGIAEAAPAPWMRPAAGLALLAADARLAVSGIGHLARLASRSIPLFWNTRLVAIGGKERAETARLRHISGRETTLAVDIVATNEGFSPASELARLLGVAHRVRLDGFARLEAVRGDDGSTDQGDIFVVGEAGGFGGAPVAEAQGRLAGREAARRLGFAAIATPAADLARSRRFQSRLWRLFSAPDPGLSRATPDTPVCRCECVSLGEITAALADPLVRDLAGLKRLTRAGMGRCQGRYCLGHLARLVPGPADALDYPAPQMPLKPLPLAALAVEKPEWGGHKRAMLPPARPPADRKPLPVASADIVVIGAGIAGLASALFLARAGADVVVIDRGEINGRASGGNAGSLHGQLLSFDHGSKANAGAGGSPAARTLPLQRDSIALWLEIERETGGSFEISLTGGLMVAETEGDLAFLADKTALERANGIDCHVIGADDLRRLEPALDDGLVGAAYCPGEGKINPLLATQGVLRAALAAGARVFPGTNVEAIERDGAGFVVETPRGPLRARRIVNAAGGFAAEVGRMLDRPVPVFGAPLQMIVTEPATPLITRLIAHADRHLTLKQATNGSLLIGGGWSAGLDPVFRHPRPNRASLEGNLWIAQRTVPALRRLHIIRSWAAMNIDIDGAPILGEDPGLPGLFYAVTSNGYTLGPLVGRMTADLVLTGATDRDVAPFSLARFGGAAT